MYERCRALLDGLVFVRKDRFGLLKRRNDTASGYLDGAGMGLGHGVHSSFMNLYQLSVDKTQPGH